MISPDNTFVIVGAGVFGVSTAYHLIKKYPKASVTLVDRDAFNAERRVAASWDWNKVVRADYDDLVYCRLGLEAQDIFKTDPLWKPYFHQTGIFWMCRSSKYAQDVINNFKTIGRFNDISAVPVDEARQLYGGLFDDADYRGVQEVLVNKNSGWGAAGDCLRAITRKVLDLGVQYVTSEVKCLSIGEESRCLGVETEDGQILRASCTILCTGAFTPKFLELSAESSGLEGLRAGTRIVAGGITTGMTQLDDNSYERFASMPVGVQGYTAQTGKIPSQLLLVTFRGLTSQLGPFIGSLPPTKDRELKWWGQTIFKNTREVLPGRFISMPPPQSDYGQWEVSGRLKEDIDFANNVFYGKKGANWKMEKHRICW